MKLRALNSIKGLKPNDEYVLPREEFDIKDPVEALRLIAEEAAEEVVEEDLEGAIEDELAKITSEEETKHLADEETNCLATEEQDKLRAAEVKAELLGRITAAKTVAELNELLPKDGDDAEIVTAFDAKLAEIKPEN